MPKIVEQSGANQSKRTSTPKSKTTQNGTAASGILARAVSVEELESHWIKALVYGHNRTGKTTLACSFPKPLLLLSLEPNETGGALSVKKFKGVKHLRLATSGEIEQVVSELPNSGYKTVVLDTVTSLQDIALCELLGLERLPAQMEVGTVSSDMYRRRAERVKHLLRPYADLKCHTVFLGKEKDHNPPKEEKVNERTGKVQPDMRPRFLRGMQLESFVSVDLGGATAGWLQDVCDFIGRLYFDKEIVVEEVKQGAGVVRISGETGRYIRCLRTKYHPNFAAGIRSCNPETVPECIEEPTYEKIAALVGAE